MNESKLTVAFDIDGTLLGDNDRLLLEQAQKVYMYIDLHANVILWSWAGKQHAYRIAQRLGVERQVKCYDKEDFALDRLEKFRVDIAYDDNETWPEGAGPPYPPRKLVKVVE